MMNDFVAAEDNTTAPLAAVESVAMADQAIGLRDLKPSQWRSGIAAWLGWMFDGLDMHLYTAVALPFVAELLQTDIHDPAVGYRSSLVQAAFLFGWAIGGGFFGRLGDRLGRARALVFTILTYAVFTGLSSLAQAWWHLLIFRFLAALGIGGEWAVGAALLSETWPRRWGPWIAAVLQTAVNVGIVLAMAAVWILSSLELGHRVVFLIGILPALIVVWIRRAVPEPEEWHAAKTQAGNALPRIVDLFRGPLRRTTILVIAVCSLSLSAHWAFMFWYLQHFRTLPGIAELSDSQKTQWTSLALMIFVGVGIAGNFLAAAVARRLGYRRAIAIGCVLYFALVTAVYSWLPSWQLLMFWFGLIGMCQGVFGLFTMYLPALFPTLLRTTGAGFCYNIGRIAAAFATVFFGTLNRPGDFQAAIIYSSLLFLPAAAIALLLPEP
jgi:MFS family permease